jgi:hypothetical protein
MKLVSQDTSYDYEHVKKGGCGNGGINKLIMIFAKTGSFCL